MPTISLTNLSKGAFAPALHGRIDTSQYQAGAKVINNFIIQRYGGLAFRPGFRFVGEVEDFASERRYVPFQFNIEQAYVMDLFDEKMQLLANGGQVIEENLAITAITQAANAQVTAIFHDYLVGDPVYFYGITGMTELNGRIGRVLTVIDDDNFIIDIDTTGFTAFVSSTGATRVAAPPAVPPLTPPDAPPALPTPAESTDFGGSGADIGEIERPGRYEGLIP